MRADFLLHAAPRVLIHAETTPAKSVAVSRQVVRTSFCKGQQHGRTVRQDRGKHIGESVARDIDETVRCAVVTGGALAGESSASTLYTWCTAPLVLHTRLQELLTASDQSGGYAPRASR